jgi:hypothetical protein
MSINKAVTLVPIAILVMVSLIQGVFEYINDMENAIKNRVELAKVSAQPIVNLMNHSVGGGNYANIQDEDALNLFQANKAVEYLSVQGKTDLQSNDFAALYDAQTHIIYRTIYSDDYLASREKKLVRIDAALSKLPQVHKKRVKLAKMRTRFTSEINQFEQQKKITEQLNNKYQKPSAELIKNYYYLDFEKDQLHLILPLKNKRGGELWMVLDASEIKSLWKDILFDILPLTCLLLTIAIFLMLFISRSINRPLSKMLATVQHVEIDSDLSQRIESS